MTTESATIMHRYANLSVVQMPGRKFPALAIQGDTILNAARQLQRGLASKEGLDSDDLREVNEELKSFANYYLAILEKHNIPSPLP